MHASRLLPRFASCQLRDDAVVTVHCSIPQQQHQRRRQQHYKQVSLQAFKVCPTDVSCMLSVQGLHNADTSRVNAGYPAEFFKRLKLPAEVVQACINACRSNDL